MLLTDTETLARMTTNKGLSLMNISMRQPAMLIFLRHLGCNFCREAMADLSTLRPSLIKQNIELVLVHMGENDVAEEYFKKFNLSGVSHISDINCIFYKSFGLMKGTSTQLFGFQSWVRGFTTIAKYGSDLGQQLGDSFQMPGAYMIFAGEIRDSYIHKKASDRPDYMKLANCCYFG
jgi:peroxiredoxin